MKKSRKHGHQLNSLAVWRTCCFCNVGLPCKEIALWQELEKKDEEEEKSKDEKDETKDKEDEDDEAEEPEEYDEEEYEEV